MSGPDLNYFGAISGIERPEFGTSQVNREGCISCVDAFYARVLGRPIEQILGRHFLEFTSSESREESLARFIKLMTQGGSLSFRKYYVRPDGHRVYALVSVNALHDRSGAVAGTLAVCQPLETRGQISSRAGGDASAQGGESQRLLSSGQSRAARGWLGWSVRDLAEASEVSSATINRFEADPTETVIRQSSVSAIRRSLEARGIAFFDDLSGNPALSKAN